MGDLPDIKMVRLRLYADEWDKLRVRAAEEDVSVTSLVNRLVRQAIAKEFA